VEQLGELRRLIASHDHKDVKILAVSTDAPSESKQLIRELTGGSDEFPIPLLEDREHRVINRYGLFNPDSGSLPHPATFIIDKERMVRWRFVEVNYRERASNQEVLRELNKL